jgi:hypothetical protein
MGGGGFIFLSLAESWVSLGVAFSSKWGGWLTVVWLLGVLWLDGDRPCRTIAHRIAPPLPNHRPSHCTAAAAHTASLPLPSRLLPASSTPAGPGAGHWAQGDGHQV